MLDKLPNKPRVKPRECTAIQGGPGSKTSKIEQNRCVMLNTDAEFNSKIAWTCWETQAEVKNAKMWGNAWVEEERVHAMAHVQSMTVVEEDGQCTSADDEDAPSTPPEPPPPLTSPDEHTRQHEEPLSIKLKGERRSCVSCNDRPTSNVTDMSASSRQVKDTSNVLRKLQEMLECEKECSKSKEEANSPARPGEELDEPGGEMTIPDDFQTSQQCLRNDSNKHSGKTNTPDWVIRPGDCRCDQGELRGVKDEWDFESTTSRMVQRQQRSVGEPSEREHYSLYCWVYLQDSACCKLSCFGVRENLYFQGVRPSIYM